MFMLDVDTIELSVSFRINALLCFSNPSASGNRRL
jgi:hypothetical protein